MGFKVKIEAKESVDLGIETVTSVKFLTETPNDSNARSTDLGLGVEITGKIRANIAGIADETVKLAQWALVPAEDATCYGKVSVDVISGGKVVRQIVMDTVYVVAYKETFADETGVGTFVLTLKQKKDKNNTVEYQGGFSY
ncbi:MAG: membrane-associated protease 1 [Lachnospiraceae bacterium]|nr:membrane-associated protease 1 [Lachnospiraceae bacterium]